MGKIPFTLKSIPALRDIFSRSAAMWSFQVRFSFIRTPRNSAVASRSIVFFCLTQDRFADNKLFEVLFDQGIDEGMIPLFKQLYK